MLAVDDKVARVSVCHRAIGGGLRSEERLQLSRPRAFPAVEEELEAALRVGTHNMTAEGVVDGADAATRGSEEACGHAARSRARSRRSRRSRVAAPAMRAAH